MARYRGFSTQAWVGGKGRLYETDVEIVKQDLMNHFNTRYGERVHMIAFGSRRTEFEFELMVQESVDELKNDVRRVINADPRVALVDIQAYAVSEVNTIIIAATLNFLELNVIDVLNIEYQGGASSVL